MQNGPGIAVKSYLSSITGIGPKHESIELGFGLILDQIRIAMQKLVVIIVPFRS